MGTGKIRYVIDWAQLLAIADMQARAIASSRGSKEIERMRKKHPDCYRREDDPVPQITTDQLIEILGRIATVKPTDTERVVQQCLLYYRPDARFELHSGLATGRAAGGAPTVSHTYVQGGRESYSTCPHMAGEVCEIEGKEFVVVSNQLLRRGGEMIHWVGYVPATREEVEQRRSPFEEPLILAELTDRQDEFLHCIGAHFDVLFDPTEGATHRDVLLFLNERLIKKTDRAAVSKLVTKLTIWGFLEVLRGKARDGDVPFAATSRAYDRLEELGYCPED